MSDRAERDRAYYQHRKARANRRCACGVVLAPTSASAACRRCAAVTSAPMRALLPRFIAAGRQALAARREAEAA